MQMRTLSSIQVFDPEVAKYLCSKYGEDLFQKICSVMTHPPIISSIRVNHIHSLPSSSSSLSSHVDHHEKHVERMKQAQQLLSQLLNEKYVVSVHGPSIAPDCLTVPVHGPIDRTICNERFVVVDKKCGEAVLRGANVFAPGILGASAQLHSEDKVSVFSDVKGKTLKGYKFKDSVSNILKREMSTNETTNSHQLSEDNETVDRKDGNDKEMMNDKFERKLFSDYIYIGNGVMKQDRRTIFAEKKGVAVEMTEPIFSTCPLNQIHESNIQQFFVQNLASMIVSHIVDPKPGETVLDMCGAPGGKTSHMAGLMNNEGVIYTCDRHQSKVNSMKKLFQSMGLTNIRSVRADSTKLTQSTLDSVASLKNASNSGEAPSKKAKQSPLTFEEESFDKILLDAPCSGIGNRPTLSYEDISLTSLQQTALYQRQLISEAVKLCKTGGTITYSTCTINCMENEENVQWALEKYKDVIELRSLRDKYAETASCGLESILGVENSSKVLRFCPYNNPEHIGFFTAQFTKLASTKVEN